MNILLLGEFSGLHKNLKDGLRELGHNALVASTGDGFKSISADINLNGTLPKYFGKIAAIESIYKPLLKFKNLCGYDVAQLLQPFMFSNRYFPSEIFIKMLKKKNSGLFLVAAGSDAFYWRYGWKRLKYSPCEEALKYDFKEPPFNLSEQALLFNKKLVEMSDGIIPVMYEYEISYKDIGNRLPTIPLPINTKKIKYEDNIIKKKLVLFHGLNRYGFKGTRHVEKAFSYLSEKYPKDIECHIAGRMPLEKYLELMGRVNVVIDQLYSYSAGMNALYALAMGKIVLGGSEPESLESLGVASSPILNVHPSSESIIEHIKNLLENSSSITEMGYESRKFVELNHNHVNIAEKYLETWKG